MDRLVSLVKNTLHPEPTDIYHLQLLRSLIVSLVAVVVNIGGYYILKQVFGIHYLISAPIGYCLGVVVNYYLSVKWVFATRKLNSVKREFVLFVIINLIGLVIYEALVAVMVETVKINQLIAPVIATIIIFFWNFLARKKVLY